MAYYKEFKPVNNVTKQPKKTANTLAVIVIFIVSVCSVLACFFSGYLAIKDFRSKNTAYADEVFSYYTSNNYSIRVGSTSTSNDIAYFDSNIYNDLWNNKYNSSTIFSNVIENVSLNFTFQNFRRVGNNSRTACIDIVLNLAESNIVYFNNFVLTDQNSTVYDNYTITLFRTVNDNYTFSYVPDVISGGYSNVGFSLTGDDVGLNPFRPHYYLYSGSLSKAEPQLYYVPMFFYWTLSPETAETFDFHCYKMESSLIPFAITGNTFIYWLRYRFYFPENGLNPNYIDIYFYQNYQAIYRNTIYYSNNYTVYSRYFADANYANGYGAGYDLGYDTGYASGSNIGESVGYTNGYATGYTDGDLQGYNRGINSANQYTFFNLLSAVVDAPVQALTGLLNFNILGFNMLNFFTGLLTLAIILFIVRKILGG